MTRRSSRVFPPPFSTRARLKLVALFRRNARQVRHGPEAAEEGESEEATEGLWLLCRGRLLRAAGGVVW